MNVMNFCSVIFLAQNVPVPPKSYTIKHVLTSIFIKMVIVIYILQGNRFSLCFVRGNIFQISWGLSLMLQVERRF